MDVLKCEPCKEREIDTDASKYCVTCQESQCKECAEVHKSYKLTRQHLLVQIENRKISLKLNNELKSLQKCDKHAGKQLEFFCTNHKEFVCSTCLLVQTNHIHCSKIINISACLTNAESNKVTDKICNDFDKTILQARLTKENLLKTCENTKLVTQQVSEKLDSIRDAFLKQFEEQKSLIIKSAEKHVGKNVNRCIEMMKGIDDLIANADETEKLLKKIINLERDPNTVHCILLSIEKMKELKKETDAICTECTGVLVAFENSSLTGAIEKKIPIIKCHFKETKLDVTNSLSDITNEEQIFEYLSKYNEESMNKKTNESDNGNIVNKRNTGEVSASVTRNDSAVVETCTGSFDDMKTHTTMTLENDQTDKYLDRTMLEGASKVCAKKLSSSVKNPPSKEADVQLKYCERFDIKDKDGLIVWIGGIVCLNDDRLVLSDYLNMRLVVLNTDHNISKLIPVKKGPRFLSLFNNDTILVCLIKRAQIMLIQVVDNDIKNERYLNTRFHPKAVLACGQNTILVTMQDGLLVWHVDIIDLKGKMLQTVNFKDLYDGYKTAVLVSETPDSSVILIQYCNASRQVRCLNIDGTLVFNYKVDDVSRIATDQRRRNIFILRYCGEVIVLSSDGKLKGKLKKTAMFKANFVTMNSSKDKLYITTYKEAKIHTLSVVYEQAS